MTPFRPGRATLSALLVASSLLAAPRPAAADITAYLGTAPSFSGPMYTGAAAGFSVFFIGVEFEYCHAPEGAAAGVPSLDMGSANILVETPTGRVRLYGTIGVGVYRETLDGDAATNTSTNVGGGITVGLAGPLGLRLDYRVLSLRGSRRQTAEQRLYAGLSLGF